MKKKVIAIDAGHGLHTSGKRCFKSLDKNETREWFLNDCVASKVVSLLKKYDCDVFRTDDSSGKSDVSLSKRCSLANSKMSDVFVSIHHDSTDSVSDASGVSVFCYNNPDNTTKNFRSIMYNSIIASNKNKGNRSNGLRESNFFVLVNTNMPALLIENGFMSSKVDVDKILSKEYQVASANGIVNAIVSFLDLKLCSSSKKSKFNPYYVSINSPDGWLWIRDGAGFNYKSNSKIFNSRVLYTIVEEKCVDGVNWGRLKSGKGWISVDDNFVLKYNI